MTIISYYDNRVSNWAIGEFDESKVFRDRFGRFSRKTTIEEKQAKMNVVRLDFHSDNYLPPLNIEEQERFNIPDVPVRIKKERIEGNLKHFDVNGYDDDYIVGSALYNPTMFLPAKRPNAYHLISKIGKDKNSLVLPDIEYNKNDNFLDVIHYFYIDDNKISQLKRNK